MYDFVIQLIPTALVLGVLIFVHELGHFLACRVTGVCVEKFSIGFGPEVIGWRGRETRYSISLIPFGGFVKPQGESGEEIAERSRSMQAGDYLAASRRSRFLILVAGVAMNFILAYVLFICVMLMGRPVPSPEIGSFVEGLPAETSDLQVGDMVTHVNGKPVTSWQELTMSILTSDGSTLNLTVEREGRVYQVAVDPEVEEGRDIFGHPARVPRIGITRSERYVIEQYPFQEAVVHAAELEWKLILMTFEALWRLVTGQLSPKVLVGPLGIVSLAGTAAQLGLATVMQFTALLSVSLGVINLLPIPALDGGHILFLGIETIRRKPVSLKIQERFTQFGFGFLMILMVWVVFNDLNNLGAIEKVKSFFSS